MDEEQTSPSRRTLLKGAAWATPVIAVAAATPAAVASEAPNDEADFRWAQESQGTYGDLVIDSDELGGTYSIQYSFEGEDLPDGAEISITVTFDGPPITPKEKPSNWTMSPESGSSDTFTFTKSAEWGEALTFNFDASGAVPESASASMTIINGGDATWTDHIDVAPAVHAD